MSKVARILLVFALLFAALSVIPVGAQGISLDPVPEMPFCGGTTLASGAKIAICMPASWNGDLVIFAHGYVGPDPERPPEIPFTQLIIDPTTPNLTVPGLVTSMGYAFAVTSYRVNGLAIKDGVADLVDLVDAVKALVTPLTINHVFIVGVSEGGLVTTLAIEQRPDVFSGGMACCGPVGDFEKQLDYFGDFRVVFDYFFPEVLTPYGGDAMHVPQLLVLDGANAIDNAIDAAIARPDLTAQLLNVTKAAIDVTDPNSALYTIRDVLVYDIYATNNAVDVLGGVPFNNKRPYTWYSGSNNDKLLNNSVARFTADKKALREISRFYTTSGMLVRPLVTMHNTGDPVVPYWHEVLYRMKTVRSRSALNLINIPINRYGHCVFTPAEVLFGFNLLVFRVTGSWPLGVEQALPTVDLQQQFNSLKVNLETTVQAAVE